MALQFRDNRFTQAEAERAAETYAATVGGRDYSRREALSAVRSAYRRPAREPWGSNRQWSGSRQPRREITGDDFDRMLARGIAEVAYQIQPIRPVLVPQSVARFRSEEFHRLLESARDAAQRERIARRRGLELIGALDFEHADWEVIDEYCLADQEADRLAAVASWLERAPAECRQAVSR